MAELPYTAMDIPAIPPTQQHLKLQVASNNLQVIHLLQEDLQTQKHPWTGEPLI